MPDRLPTGIPSPSALQRNRLCQGAAEPGHPCGRILFRQTDTSSFIASRAGPDYHGSSCEPRGLQQARAVLIISEIALCPSYWVEKVPQPNELYSCRQQGKSHERVEPITSIAGIGGSLCCSRPFKIKMCRAWQQEAVNHALQLFSAERNFAPGFWIAAYGLLLWGHARQLRSGLADSSESRPSAWRLHAREGSTSCRSKAYQKWLN